MNEISNEISNEIEEVISLSEFIELIQDWDAEYLSMGDYTSNVKIDFDDQRIRFTINNISDYFTSILSDLLPVRICDIPNLEVVINDASLGLSIILEKEKITETLSDGTKIDATEAVVSLFYYIFDGGIDDPLASWGGHYSWDEKVPSKYKGIDFDEIKSYLDTFIYEHAVAHNAYLLDDISAKLKKR